jgi:hypothetical protein
MGSSSGIRIRKEDFRIGQKMVQIHKLTVEQSIIPSPRPTPSCSPYNTLLVSFCLPLVHLPYSLLR